MTPEQQQRAIASACGWTDLREEEIEFVDFDSRSVSVCVGWRGLHPSLGSRKWLPEYTTDLNAMHEAEIFCVYSKGLGMVYLENLAKVTEKETYQAYGTTQRRWHASATAAQRAEAFLRTMGKWEESA